MNTGALFKTLTTILCAGFIVTTNAQQIPNVLSAQKISDTEGSFTGTLNNGELFGCSATSIGDLDNDGIDDIAVGEYRDSDGGTDRGAVWILFMNSDGTVDSHQKISDTQGGFTGTLELKDYFGLSVAALGDLDGDGNEDIAVSAHGDDDGGTNRGAIWILFLDTDGTVISHQKISDTQGSFTGTLDDSDYLGASINKIGDLDGDGKIDIAVGASRDDDGGTDRGAIWIMNLNSDGTVDSHQKISDTQGSFTGTLDNSDQFGISSCGIGDINNDGVGDLAVGAYLDDDGGTDRGAVWVLLMNTNGTVSSHQKISDPFFGQNYELIDSDKFGRSVANIGDIDNDGVNDLIVGAHNDDHAGTSSGAAYIITLQNTGELNDFKKVGEDISWDPSGAGLDAYDLFALGSGPIGDLDGNGTQDFLVGSPYDDDGGSNRGAIWVFFMDDLANSQLVGQVKTYQRISDIAGNFTETIDDNDCFGQSVANIGDLDNDGVDDLVVGSYKDDDGSTDRGAVYILFHEYRWNCFQFTKNQRYTR